MTRASPTNPLITLTLILALCPFVTGKPALLTSLTSLSSLSNLSSLSKSSYCLIALTATSLLFLAYKLFAPIYPSQLTFAMNRFAQNTRLTRPGRGMAYDGRAETKEANAAAMATGGAIGGLNNSSNQCFMNSVLQSMASSVELNAFFDSYIDGNDKYKTPFSFKLRNLLGALNGQYATRSRTFTTDGLLLVMKDAPRTNFMGHQDQEDAQEFYQNVMKNVEKEYKHAQKTEEESGESADKPSDPFVPLLPTHLVGVESLSMLGPVALPARQVDPNLSPEDERVLTLELVTPVDGISAERIGCLSCGEMGGVRYRVISGVSLNLPQPTASNDYYGRVAMGERYDLEPLMHEWIKPEIMEGVTCNRCALSQCRSAAATFLEGDRPEALQARFRERLAEIDAELAKSVVDDGAYEKFKNSSTVDKVKKSKQIFFSRPPPVLNIHINRSYYDPRTYSLRKNDATVAVPLKLHMEDYVAVPEDINMDARLPFRKQDLGRVGSPEEQAACELVPEAVENESESESESESDSDSGKGPDLGGASDSEGATPLSDSSDEDSLEGLAPSASVVPEALSPEIPDGPLTYHLKSIVVHSGLHNYGHYVCYRHYRGTWWYISDDDVFVVTADHLRNLKGVFMVFYEITPNPAPEIVALALEKSPSVDELGELESEGEMAVTSDEAEAAATATANL